MHLVCADVHEVGLVIAAIGAFSHKPKASASGQVKSGHVGRVAITVLVVIAVAAQRLVRKICTNCRKPYEPNATERRILGIPADRVGTQVFRGVGCSRCLRSGYYDRVGIFEFIPFDEGLSALVMEKAATEVLQKYAVAHGAITLREDAVTKVRDGLTTLEEALRVTIIDA